MKKLALVAIVLLPGCISKVLQIRSDPPGARVYIDGEYVGTTPVDHSFTHYGARHVLVVKELDLAAPEPQGGPFEPFTDTIELDAPWWGYFPIDLFVTLWPGKVTDRHERMYPLTPGEEADVNLDRVLANLDKLRERLSPQR